MSLPKISNVSVSFNDENNENFPVTIISNNKFKSIINKSIGIGTYDEEKKQCQYVFYSHQFFLLFQ